MSITNPKALLEQLSWRYATKKFDSSKKIPADIWQSLEQVLVLSPSSYGLQPWKFIVVNDRSVRKQLRAVSWNQSQIEDASHLLVIAAKKNVGAAEIDKLISAISSTRGIPTEALKEYRGMMLGSLVPPPPGMNVAHWTSKQCYIALGCFLSACAALQIDACPMEGFDASKYDEILGLGQQGYTTAVIATAGYRASDDSYAGLKKVRYSASELIEHR